MFHNGIKENVVFCQPLYVNHANSVNHVNGVISVNSVSIVKRGATSICDDIF